MSLPIETISKVWRLPNAPQRDHAHYMVPGPYHYEAFFSIIRRFILIA